MKNMLLISALSLSFVSYSQFKNSNDNSVFTIDNSSISRFKFSGGETALEYNVYNWQSSYTYIGGLIPTVSTYNAIILKGGLTNTKKFVDLDEFELDKQGILFGIGYIRTIKDIFQPVNFWTFRINAEYKFDNFRNYDPLTEKDERKHPKTFSINGGATRYFLSTTSNFAWALSISGSYNPITYNSSDLINFKNLSTEVVNNDIIVAFKDFDGKYGTINNKMNGGNLSASLPLFFDYDPTLRKPYIVPLVYGTTQFLSNNFPKYYSGLSIGIFPKKIFEKNSAPVELKSRQIGNKMINKTNHNPILSFNSPSFISIGVDYSFQSGHKASKPNFFLSGSISF